MCTDGTTSLVIFFVEFKVIFQSFLGKTIIKYRMNFSNIAHRVFLFFNFKPVICVRGQNIENI